MHETSLIPNLIEKIEAVAKENAATRITSVELAIGALAAISPDHLKEHFDEAVPGTLAEGAELKITISEDPLAPESNSVRLTSVEIET